MSYPQWSQVLTTIPRKFAADFTTESTEITETGRKEGRVSEPDPKLFLSGLCALCALCGETPDRAGGRVSPEEFDRAAVTAD